MPSSMVEILTVWSPHKQLKNRGPLSEYAKCSKSSTNKKKFEILTLNPRYDKMVKKPSHATVPLSGELLQAGQQAVWRDTAEADGQPNEADVPHGHCATSLEVSFSYFEFLEDFCKLDCQQR